MPEIKNNNSTYLSLQEAAELSPYSQEYLSLRARQGRLKAIKLGRNWVTTKDWLQEYFEKAEEYKNGNGKTSKTAPPPQNLPIEIILKPSFFDWKFATAFYSIIILFAVVSFFGKSSFSHVAKSFDPYVISFSTAVDNKLNYGLEFVSDKFNAGKMLAKNSSKKSFNALPEILKKIGSAGKFTSSVLSSVSDSIKNIAKNIAKAFKAGASKIAGILKSGWRALARLWQGPEKEEQKGMVVVPSGPNDEVFKRQVAENFSDEVKVEIKDETSGIITPVFKEKIGDRYLYIMVPIKN